LVTDSSRPPKFANLTVFTAPRCASPTTTVDPTRSRTPTMPSDSSDDDVPLARASHCKFNLGYAAWLPVVRTVARMPRAGEPGVDVSHFRRHQCHCARTAPVLLTPVLSFTVSAPTISPADDREMDKSASKARPGPPGLSIRHGPVDDQMDIDSATNGAAKRKSRSSVSQTVKYKDESDSEDEAPLVCLLFSAQESSQTTVG
jgi:hypothetical protein